MARRPGSMVGSLFMIPAVGSVRSLFLRARFAAALVLLSSGCIAGAGSRGYGAGSGGAGGGGGAAVDGANASGSGGSIGTGGAAPSLDGGAGGALGSGGARDGGSDVDAAGSGVALPLVVTDYFTNQGWFVK